MSKLVDEVKKIRCINKCEKITQQINVVEEWERAGWISKPITPMYDNSISIPNVSKEKIKKYYNIDRIIKSSNTVILPDEWS